MMGNEGELKLIDFGLAKKFHNFQGQNVKKMIGTPYYLAPEAL
jgi:serine/threonine protein kinase